jgi:hypothetical protein
MDLTRRNLRRNSAEAKHAVASIKESGRFNARKWRNHFNKKEIEGWRIGQQIKL